jgi:hypothetical protein
MGAFMAAVVITCTIIVVSVLSPKSAEADDSWIDGSWQGKIMKMDFNAQNNTFAVSTNDTIMQGEFTLEEPDSLRLVDSQGQHYLYTYEKIDPNTLRVSFADGISIVRETLTRQED